MHSLSVSTASGNFRTGQACTRHRYGRGTQHPLAFTVAFADLCDCCTNHIIPFTIDDTTLSRLFATVPGAFPSISSLPTSPKSIQARIRPARLGPPPSPTQRIFAKPVRDIRTGFHTSFLGLDDSDTPSLAIAISLWRCSNVLIFINIARRLGVAFWYLNYLCLQRLRTISALTKANH